MPLTQKERQRLVDVMDSICDAPEPESDWTSEVGDEILYTKDAKNYFVIGAGDGGEMVWCPREGRSYTLSEPDKTKLIGKGTDRELQVGDWVEKNGKEIQVTIGSGIYSVSWGFSDGSWLGKSSRNEITFLRPGKLSEPEPKSRKKQILPYYHI